ncbi:hypothetical protein DPMN_154774 [Dreissena polymorpha]|uniref:Uncharacterized protein n=1 Tax=Dreissena polymorpha TaxID=45954 RepID=A0A9D4FLN8_DREPO|nr:hypothetical protein DPMN_154774 [Dreissena polymorpha]
MINLSSDNHLVDGPTDRQTDMSKAIYPLFFEGGHKYQKCFLKEAITNFQLKKGIFWVGAWESGIIMSISMKETHWKTMRISGRVVSMNEPHWKTMRISGIMPLWKTMRISGIKPGIRTEESILSILSLKEPGISTQCPR